MIVDPLRPNDRPLLLLITRADRLLEVVPAETFMLVRLVAMLAVTVEAFNPKLTLLALPKVRAERLFEVVPALTLMLLSRPAVDGTV